MRRAIYNIFKTTPPISLEKVVGLFAPHSCYGCGATGRALCDQCSELTLSPPPPRCYNCQKISDTYKICQSCKRTLSIDSIIYAGAYDGIHKQLIMTMKKDASRAVCKDIAQALATLYSQQPYLLNIDGIVPVPTISAHVRTRGFDHTYLIAKELSRITGLPVMPLLERTTSTRQVGKSRRERFEQMENGVKLKEVKSLNGVKIMLIDDIVTTGATLSASARALKSVGASRVDGVVFASGN